MTWAGKRQMIIVLLILGVISIVAFYYLEPIFTKPPTCTDGKMNGMETGTDCGGGCINFCSNEIKMPIILWKRAFPVTSSVYNAVAYIENQNAAAISALPYEFRLYGANGLLIARVEGKTTIVPPLGRYAIVETGIKVGNAKVASTTFEFGKASVPWLHIPEEISKLHLSVSNVNLSDTDSIPKLKALLSNPSPTITVNNTTVSAILYDASDNAITVSETAVPILGAGVSVPIFFTWPGPIKTAVARYDIIPIIDVFHTTK